MNSEQQQRELREAYAQPAEMSAEGLLFPDEIAAYIDGWKAGASLLLQYVGSTRRLAAFAAYMDALNDLEGLRTDKREAS